MFRVDESLKLVAVSQFAPPEFTTDWPVLYTPGEERTYNACKAIAAFHLPTIPHHECDSKPIFSELSWSP